MIGMGSSRGLGLGTVAAVLAFVGLSACSSTTGSGTTAACTPGQQSGCACPGGATGIQTCNQDGRSFGPCLGCGGSSTGGDSGVGSDTPTAAYCAEHCDDFRCQSVVTCVDEAPSTWTGPVALALTSGTLPPCDATFQTKLFEGGNEPKADPTVCGTRTCGPGNAGSNVCNIGAASPNTIPPAGWTNRAIGCRANAASGGNCGAGKVCSPRPSTLFRQSLCITNLSGDVPCPSGPYSQRYVIGQSINDTRACGTPTCNSYPVCSAVPNPPTGTLTATSLVTVCCTS